MERSDRWPRGRYELDPREQLGMTRLLVSVRSAAEAKIALAGGADLIDVKEPRHGSLGAADANVTAEVVHAVAGRKPVSAAGGELRDAAGLTRPAGLTYFKFGLAGCGDAPAWTTDWLRAAGGAARRQLVAVVYADWQAASAPCPAEVLAAAHAHGAGVVLVDTWCKTAGDLLAHWTVSDVRQFALAVQQRGMATAMAGSLTRETIARLLPGPFDWIAVRGAACRAGRASPIDLDRVRDLAQLVHSHEHLGPGPARLNPIAPELVGEGACR